MKRVLAIGELLIDFVPHQRGCALREVESFSRVAGGAPANVVTAVSRLGGRGAMVSQVGDDAFGEHIVDVLNRNGVDTSYVFKSRQANTGLAFVSLDSTGNREFSFFRNPSADMLLAPEQVTPEMLADCSVLHFCSVDLVDRPVKQAHRRLLELAQERGVTISFDPNVRLPLWDSPKSCQEAIREFLPYANIVKLSDDELEFVTGCRTEEEAAEMLFQMNCNMMILTKGGEGSSVYTKNAQAHHDALPISVVDTTGAGDSFIGSFLFQFVRDRVVLDQIPQLSEQQLWDYLDFSAHYAAMTCQHQGAVMATLAELEAYRAAKA